MARKKTGRTDHKSYRVGYGRPPVETRFKPNQSGNPKGRPKRQLTFPEVVSEVLAERVEIRSGDRTIRMTNRHALVRNAIRRALNGDPKLLRALPGITNIETIRAEDVEAKTSITAEDEAILEDFMRRNVNPQAAPNNSADAAEEPTTTTDIAKQKGPKS